MILFFKTPGRTRRMGIANAEKWNSRASAFRDKRARFLAVIRQHSRRQRFAPCKTWTSQLLYPYPFPAQPTHHHPQLHTHTQRRPVLTLFQSVVGSPRSKPFYKLFSPSSPPLRVTKQSESQSVWMSSTFDLLYHCWYSDHSF